MLYVANIIISILSYITNTKLNKSSLPEQYSNVKLYKEANIQPTDNSTDALGLF